MRVLTDLSKLPKFRNAVITIGTFDGVHKGHQQLIKRISELAKNINGESVIVTFHPHPRLVINPQDNTLQLLNTVEEKIALLESYGIDNVVIVPFSRSFSEQSADDYIEYFLVKNFQPKQIVIGYDHKFGKNRSGDINLLRQMRHRFGYEVDEIQKETLEQITISSTKIRHALNEGSIQIANDLLGHNYSIEGLVVKGLQNGRKLGYPTANISISDPHKLIPRKGIYAVFVHHAGTKYGGMLSIGFNPTFNGTSLSVEVNILNFNKEVYGEKLKIELLQYIRDEKKFDSTDALIKAIDGDKNVIEEILSRS
jgi:riboflavin kinase/FMN adenylyltransferase